MSVTDHSSFPQETDQTVHAFDQAIALSAVSEGLWQGQTSPAYQNMVGPYGGVTVAQALNTVLQHPKLLGEPVALTVNFAAGLNGAFLASARPARTNRSTQHWVLDFQQDGQTALTATAITAVRRKTWGTSELHMPKLAPPQEVPMYQRPAFKEWLNRYELRIIDGDLPATWDDGDLQHSSTRLWMRDAPPRQLDFASLAAMCDLFFPRIWRRRARSIPLGTISMSVYFHADSTQLRACGTGYLHGRAQAQAFRNGYFDQTAQVWSEAGDLLATSHQIVYYKE